MKKTIGYIILLITMMSCSYYGTYVVRLNGVEYPKNIKINSDSLQVIEYQDQGITKYMYEDSQISISWLPLNSQFSFNLINKSNHTMKIIWDDAVYVNENGNSQRVLHKGVKYIDRDNSQLSTIINRGSNVDDVIIPTDNIHFVSGYGWKEFPLFKNNARSTDELYILEKKYVGKTVKILLPIKKDDIINEYIFTFKIENFKCENDKKLTKKINITNNRRHFRFKP